MMIQTDATSNFIKGRAGATPDLILCHGCVGELPACLQRFQDRRTGKAPHFLIGPNGTVHQLVSLSDTAPMLDRPQNSRAASDPNCRCVALVFCCDRLGAITDAQQDAAVALLRVIRDQLRAIYHVELELNAATVRTHSAFAPDHAHCPGEQFPLRSILERLAPRKPRYRAVLTGYLTDEAAEDCLRRLHKQGYRTPEAIPSKQGVQIGFALHNTQEEAMETVENLKQNGWKAGVLPC